MTAGGADNKRRAFTLVEALIAIIVVSFTIFSIIAVFIVNRYATTISKHRAVVIAHLEREMEKVINTDYASVSPASETINFDTDADQINDLAVTKTLGVQDMSGYKKAYLKLAWIDTAAGAINLKEEAITYVTEK